MKTIGVALLVGLLTGCSLYTDDDAPPVDDVDAGTDIAPALTGTYAVTWTCLTQPDCVFPFADETLMSVSNLGNTATIGWSYPNALVPSVKHTGTLVSRTCFHVPAGAERGYERAAYDLCQVGDDAGRAVAVIAWGGTTMRMDGVRP